MKAHLILACGVGILCGALAGKPKAATVDCRSAACVNLVLDGDSISAGAGSSPGHGLDARLAAAVGEPVALHNVAVGGRPVSDCLRLYPSLVAPLYDANSQHNVIAFHAGDNDIAQGRNANQTYAAFTAYVAAAHRQGWKVVVSTELRSPHFSPQDEQELENYNRQLRRNDAHADAVVDLDADPRMSNLSYRLDPNLFSKDQIHPSDGGYTVLAAMVAPALRQVAGR